MKPLEEHAFFTIGYERRDPIEIAELLRRSGVDLLLDVRRRAQSRKAGFSKKRLSTWLAEIGIEYQHAPDLGTPDELMADRRSAGSYSLDRYARHLADHEDLLVNPMNLLRSRKIALLCFERAPTECHRLVLATRLAAYSGLKVIHL